MQHPDPVAILAKIKVDRLRNEAIDYDRSLEEDYDTLGILLEAAPHWPSGAEIPPSLLKAVTEILDQQRDNLMCKDRINHEFVHWLVDVISCFPNSLTDLSNEATRNGVAKITLTLSILSILFDCTNYASINGLDISKYQSKIINFISDNEYKFLIRHLPFASGELHKRLTA
jgi:hypothetical protein